MSKVYTWLIVGLVALWSSSCYSREQLADSSPIEEHIEEIYYFGYGSNMLAKRIHIQNPSARIVCPALLKDYRLDFATIDSSRWNGAVATIVRTPGYRIWGTLWAMNLTDLPNIDHQEGVHLKIYKPIRVQVKLVAEVPARAFALVKQPETNLHELNPVPLDRQPSKTYLKVLVKGAIESGIPVEYVDWLRGLKHNNQTVEQFEEQLELHDVVLKD